MNILFLSKMFLLKDEVRSLPWVYLRESYLFKVHSKYTVKFLAVLYSSWRALSLSLSLSLSPDRESECVCTEWREREWGKTLNNMFQPGACLAEPTKEFGTTLMSSLLAEYCSSSSCMHWFVFTTFVQHLPHSISCNMNK
jgi:hypothetical protein